MQISELMERFETFVALVRGRLEDLGVDPNTVLVVSREQLKLSAVAIPGTAAQPFTQYMRTALQATAPLEDVAEQFVASWLRQARTEQRGM